MTDLWFVRLAIAVASAIWVVLCYIGVSYWLRVRRDKKRRAQEHIKLLCHEINKLIALRRRRDGFGN